MEHLYVTNTGEKDHVDNFRGKAYVFPVGECVQVPTEFAVECLGHGWEDKTPFIARLGWSVTANDMPQAMERLAKLKVSAEPVQQDRYLTSAVDSVTPFPTTGRGRKASPKAA